MGRGDRAVHPLQEAGCGDCCGGHPDQQHLQVRGGAGAQDLRYLRRRALRCAGGGAGRVCARGGRCDHVRSPRREQGDRGKGRGRGPQAAQSVRGHGQLQPQVHGLPKGAAGGEGGPRARQGHRAPELWADMIYYSSQVASYSTVVQFGPQELPRLGPRGAELQCS